MKREQQIMLRNISSSYFFQTHYKSIYSFSYYANLDLSSLNPSFQAKDLTITHTMHYFKKSPCDSKIMTFGAFHTDHQLEIDWQEKMGYKAIITILAGAGHKQFHLKVLVVILLLLLLVMQFECCEGAKAYRGVNNKIRIFRLNCIIYRMKQSAKKFSLPDFDGVELERCIEQLLKVDRDWIPDQLGFGCNIKLTLIATTEEALGVCAQGIAKLFVVFWPAGPQIPSRLKPVRVFFNIKTICSAPGEVEAYKVASNYAPTSFPLKEVQKKGFHQILWMQSDGLVQNGICNLFFFQKNERGEKELVTPILDGTILPSIMRDSILEITRGMGKFKVVEKKLYIQEVIESIESGRMIEMFESGTVVNIQPIEAIGYNDKIYEIKYDSKLNAGELSHELFDLFTKIQTGGEDHKWINSI